MEKACHEDTKTQRFHKVFFEYEKLSDDYLQIIAMSQQRIFVRESLVTSCLCGYFFMFCFREFPKLDFVP